MIKRTLDVLFAVIAIVVLSPVILIIALAIRWNLGSPILYVQQRPGLHEDAFFLLKFRTMRNANDVSGSSLPDADRLTQLGRLLRSWSLDELPELWNVARGDMSLVGPRPLLMQYLPLYNPYQRRRHDVRPGITGWAQVNGRNTIGWEDRFQLDVWYVENRNLWLDLKILFLTVVRVLQRKGISADGEATMSVFKGTPESVAREGRK
jgi:lipopolysaccharide/colanic/teichoic acid biosynthesis glycosyltransferase